MSKGPPTISDRIAAAMEKVRARGMKVRAIYLDETDRAELDRVNTAFWRGRLGSSATFYPTTVVVSDEEEYLLVGLDQVPLPLREGGKSVIYSTHGVGVAVPVRVSPRTGPRP